MKEGFLGPLSVFTYKSIGGSLREVAGEKLTVGFSLIHIMWDTKHSIGETVPIVFSAWSITNNENTKKIHNKDLLLIT